MGVVDYTRGQSIGLVTLNRPDRLNAMNDELLGELRRAIEDSAADPEVRVLVLRGAGRGFCAGGDLAQGVGGGIGAGEPPVRAAGRLSDFGRISHLLREMPKPTIASIHGACVGAGLSVACAADLRIASSSAIFATSFLAAGLSGDFGGTWLLSRVIGPARARAAYLLGDRMDAATAYQIGLVDRVSPDDEQLHQLTMDLAHRLAHGPQLAIRYAKQNLNEALEASLAEMIVREAERHTACGRTADAAEATTAFLEKRQPQFA